MRRLIVNTNPRPCWQSAHPWINVSHRALWREENDELVFTLGPLEIVYYHVGAARYVWLASNRANDLDHIDLEKV